MTLVLGGGIVFYVTFSLPAVQRWLGRTVSSLLSDELGVKVSIQSIDASMPLRPVVYGFTLHDHAGDTLIKASRASTRVYLMPLLRGKYEIGHVQLYRPDLRVRNDSTGLNCQFLIDLFASDKQGNGNTRLRINTILLRRGSISYTYPDSKASGQSKTLSLSDLSVTVNHLSYVGKELQANLTDLDFTLGDIHLNDMSGDIVAGVSGGSVSNLKFNIGPSLFAGLEATWEPMFRQWELKCSDASISPSTHRLLQPLPPLSLQVLATGTDSTARLHSLSVQGSDLSLRLSGNLTASRSSDSLRSRSLAASIDTLELNISRQQLHRALVTYSPTLLADSLWSPMFNHDLALTASGEYSEARSRLTARLSSDMGDITADGTLANRRQWSLDIDAPQLQLDNDILSLIAPQSRLTADEGQASLQLTANGTLPQGGRLSLSSPGVFNIAASGHCQSAPLTASFKIDASHGKEGDGNLKTAIQIDRLDTKALPAARKLRKLQTFSADASTNLHWASLSNPLAATGALCVNNLRLLNDSLAPEPLMSKFALDIMERGEGRRHIYLIGDVLNGFAVHCDNDESDPSLTAYLSLSDTRLLNKLTGANLNILGRDVTLRLENDSATLHCDSLRFGNNRLNNVNGMIAPLRLNTAGGGSLWSAMKEWNGQLSVCRETRFGLTDFAATTSVCPDSITASIGWASLIGQQTDSLNCGAFSFTAHLADTMSLGINRTAMMFDGERWDVNSSAARLLPDGTLSVDSIVIKCGDRFACIDGRMSQDLNDTLRVALNGFSLDYLFGFAHTRSVDFGGQITGLVNVTGGIANPQADGLVSVDGFSLNNAVLGPLSSHVSWDTSNMLLKIDGNVQDKLQVQSDICLQRGRNSLDVNVDMNAANLAFLNLYTRNVLGDVQGAGTGHVRVHGSFRKPVIDGDLRINHATLDVPLIGGVFHFTHGRVEASEGLFRFSELHAYDKDAAAQLRNTNAPMPRNSNTITGSGSITHDFFKNIRYDFSFLTNRAKIYDKPTYGDQVFCATVVLDNGNINLNGGPGFVNVNASGSVVRGTFIEYNNSAPESIVNSDFITFVTADDKASQYGYGEVALQTVPSASFAPDIRLNFNINATPEAHIDVLMDERTKDRIRLWGNGGIRAEYYNKGSLKMNGSYQVTGGSYGLTIPGSIMRRDLKFRDGGTITFTGTPTQGELNLQAGYGVTVDLNTLAGGNLFSQARTDVDVVMNIRGRVNAPQVTFDFDLPNATSEEQSMVRSLVTTDEERDLQAIYLLGLGTFYALGDDIGNTRGNMAVNGFLSSTLSSQLNSFIGSAMGNSNWSFGTNISTGQMGWDDIQAEGSLSGRLFNDRLLLNGTFGYRDGSTLSQHTGFVGDFDIQWKITPLGTISLKGYSQTTNRYFTKSSLTTQGVGLLLKKDFNTLNELFGRKPTKKP